jgi:hypothetical protein
MELVPNPIAEAKPKGMKIATEIMFVSENPCSG